MERRQLLKAMVLAPLLALVAPLQRLFGKRDVDRTILKNHELALSNLFWKEAREAEEFYGKTENGRLWEKLQDGQWHVAGVDTKGNLVTVDGESA